jgi:hypothetical protein
VPLDPTEEPGLTPQAQAELADPRENAMVTSRNRTRLTWALALMVAALSVGRELLHYIPGSGHVTRVGQMFLRFGLPQPKSSPCDDGDGRRIGRSTSPFPIRDSGSCPICKENSQMQVLGAAIVFESPPLVLEKVGAARAPVVDACPVHAFQPRAPPAA